MYKTLHKKQGSVTVQLRFARSSVTFCAKRDIRFDYLLNVYERAKKKGLIEKVEPHTTSLMYALGDRLYQAYGDQTNIKITTKEDLALFEGYVLLQQRKMKL